jgi:hypothetical protein
MFEIRLMLDDTVEFAMPATVETLPGLLAAFTAIIAALGPDHRVEFYTT